MAKKADTKNTKPKWRVCGAKNKAGKPCQGKGMSNGRCRFHGGLTPAGVASPHFKHGLYSKHLPRKLQQQFEAVALDPEYDQLTAEIKLVTSLIARRIELLQSGIGDEDSLELIIAMMDSLDDAHLQQDLVQAKVVARSLRKAVTQASHEIKIFDELDQMLARKEKLVRGESLRRRELDGNIPVSQVIVIVNTIEKAMDVIEDAEVRSKVVRRFDELVGRVLPQGDSRNELDVEARHVG